MSKNITNLGDYFEVAALAANPAASFLTYSLPGWYIY